jgi:hypothetical protein
VQAFWTKVTTGVAAIILLFVGAPHSTPSTPIYISTTGTGEVATSSINTGRIPPPTTSLVSSTTSAINCDLVFDVDDVQQPAGNTTTGSYQPDLFIDDYQFSRPTWVVVRRDLAPHSAITQPPDPGPVVVAKLFEPGSGTSTDIVFGSSDPFGNYVVELYADNGDMKFGSADQLCARPPIQYPSGGSFSIGYNSWKIDVLSKPELWDYMN